MTCLLLFGHLFVGAALPGSPAICEKITSLTLTDALAACVLSSHVPHQHRQWAAKQLVRSISSQMRSNANALENMADITHDLPTCTITKLEGHQNRLNLSAWNEKRTMLATRLIIWIYFCSYSFKRLQNIKSS